MIALSLLLVLIVFICAFLAGAGFRPILLLAIGLACVGLIEAMRMGGGIALH